MIVVCFNLFNLINLFNCKEKVSVKEVDKPIFLPAFVHPLVSQSFGSLFLSGLVLQKYLCM